MSSEKKPELEYNEDELEAPKWLNIEFFQQVLKHHEHSNQVVINKLTISPASVKGDHYASIMFRVLVNYTIQESKLTKKTALIVKTLPEHGTKSELLANSTLFECEIAMYSEIIPKIESILRTLDDDTKLAPLCLFSSLEPHKVLIFEDLVEFGYEVIRSRPIRMDEVKKAYEKVAKFHAISFELNKKQPELFASFKNGLMSVKGIMDTNCVRCGSTNFVDLLKEIPEFEKYIKYFDGINFFEESKPFFSEYFEHRNSTTKYVLCHGDFHAKNMMFKCEPVDVMLLDFQISYMGSMAMDIIYSFITLLTPEQRIHQREEAIDYYYMRFAEALKKLDNGSDVPSKAHFHQEIERLKYFEFFLMVTFLPMWYELQSGAPDLDRIFTDDDYSKKVYRNKGFIEELKLLLPYYEQLGYLQK